LELELELDQIVMRLTKAPTYEKNARRRSCGGGAARTQLLLLLLLLLPRCFSCPLPATETFPI